MTRVAFVSGHLDITPEQWNEHYRDRIDEHMAGEGEFVVGDAKGADAMTVAHLAARDYTLVTVYHKGAQPRVNVDSLKTRGNYTSHPEKDAAMTRASHFDIAWVRPDDETRALYGSSYDPTRVSGTRRNIERRAAVVEELGGNVLALADPRETLVHQLNCLAVRPHGLSATIASAFPYANVYARRQQQGTRNLAVERDRATPGTIVVDHAPTDNPGPAIVGLFGQYDYGRTNTTRPLRPQHELGETAENRYRWFVEALRALRLHLVTSNSTSVVFPRCIGCGLAGGDWTRYRAAIVDFAQAAPYRVRIFDYERV